jgi:hypothetical protein
MAGPLAYLAYLNTGRSLWKAVKRGTVARDQVLRLRLNLLLVAPAPSQASSDFTKELLLRCV